MRMSPLATFIVAMAMGAVLKSDVGLVTPFVERKKKEWDGELVQMNKAKKVGLLRSCFFEMEAKK